MTNKIIAIAVFAVLLIFCIAYMMNATYSSFLYFDF